MAHKFALRTDKAFDQVKQFIESKQISGWCVREVSDQNEHWHWFLETDIKEASFRVLLKRAVPELKGNGSYSVSAVKDVEKYERYMAKGESEGVGPEVAWRHGLLHTPDRIDELHEEYWTENARLKKRKKGSVMDCVLDQCRREEVSWEDRKKIFDLYLRELVSRNRPVNMFAVKAAVNGLQIQLCPTDAAINFFVDQSAVYTV